MKTVCFLTLCCILTGCPDIPLPTVHEQLRQHFLEAGPGSAISFVKKPAIPQSSLHNNQTSIAIMDESLQLIKNAV